MSLLPKKGREMLRRLGIAETEGRADGNSAEIIVGFSGGADSAALLHFLAVGIGLREKITALHVNHMLRGEDAESDERFCREFCAKYGIAFESVHIDIATISGGTAIEETARSERYKALCECAARNGARYIALAHTETDNAETLIFNIVRGSGLKGACGIPPSRPCGDFTVIRPLLLCTRAETEEYCAENGIAYVTDQTNFDTHYTRNFIRHEILPLLNRINPAAEDSLGNFCALLSQDSDFIEGEADKFFGALEDKTHISRKSAISLHESVRTRVIARMYKAAGGADMDSLHIRAVCDMICGSGGTGTKTELPAGIFAVVTGDDIAFMKKSDYEKTVQTGIAEAELILGENRISDSLIYISDKPDDAAERKYCREYAVHFMKAFCLCTSEKLTARGALPSDNYRAGKITRKIKKLRTELSLAARKKRPVICASGEVIWYPGFDMCDKLKGEVPSVYIYYFEK